MNITTIELGAWLGSIWWPFLRIGSAFVMLPLFGDGYLPVWVRSLLALLMTVILYPIIAAPIQVDPISTGALVIAFEQVLFGVFFGLIVHMLTAVFGLIGQIISMQMGLSMSIMNDPSNGQSHLVLSRMLIILSTLMFLILDGHLVVMAILIDSFSIWPVGQSLSIQSIGIIIKLFGWMFTAAIALSLPAIIAMLAVNFAFGVMNRAAPSLNVFALGFPMTMILGLFSLFLAINGIQTRYIDYLMEIFEVLTAFVHGGEYV